MGATARWLCNTCMTICYGDGAHDYYGYPEEVPTPGELLSCVKSMRKCLNKGDLSNETSFLGNLAEWLSRHLGHEIRITNDSGTDMLELDVYKTEDVDGKVHELTHKGEQEEAERNARAANTAEAKSIIDKHPGNSQAAAEEIADKLIPWGYGYY